MRIKNYGLSKRRRKGRKSISKQKNHSEKNNSSYILQFLTYIQYDGNFAFRKTFKSNKIAD